MKNILAKKLFYFLILFTVSFTVFAQEDLSVNQVVYNIDFDENLYFEYEDNAYKSKSTFAILSITDYPYTLESYEYAFNGRELDEGEKIVKNEIITIKGIKLFCYITSYKNEEGKEIISQIYAREKNNEELINVISEFYSSDKDKYQNEGLKAILSVKEKTN
jgi:ASC-1-like (ASCH) protein